MMSAIIPPGTENVDEKRLEHTVKNQRFHDAPNVVVIYCEDTTSNTILAIGLVSQTLDLVALAYGLATCQIAGPTTFWPEIYREVLGTPKVLGSSEPKLIANTIAIGYPDLEAPINNFQRPREPLDALAEWHGV